MSALTFLRDGQSSYFLLIDRRSGSVRELVQRPGDLLPPTQTHIYKFSQHEHAARSSAPCLIRTFYSNHLLRNIPPHHREGAAVSGLHSTFVHVRLWATCGCRAAGDKGVIFTFRREKSHYSYVLRLSESAEEFSAKLTDEDGDRLESWGQTATRDSSPLDISTRRFLFSRCVRAGEV